MSGADDGAASAVAPVLGLLVALYAIAALYAFVQLVRLQRAVRAFTIQKLVHALVLVCALLRCVFFAIVPTWDGVYFYVRMSSDQPVDTGLYVLEEFPTLLLITMYSQQLLVWARSYHMATNSVATYTGTVVGCVWVFNAAAYLMQVLIWALYDHTSSPRAGGVAVDSDAWSLTSAVLHAAEFFVIAGFLAGYGVGVHRTVHAAPVSLQMRAKQMRAIVLVTATCTTAFLVRSLALVAASYAAWTDAGGFDDTLTTADLAGSAAFFIFTELLPLAIVLRNNGRIPGANRRGGGASPGGRKSSGGSGAGGSGGSWRSLFSKARPAAASGELEPLAVGPRSQLSPSFAQKWAGRMGAGGGGGDEDGDGGAGERVGLLAAAAGDLSAARAGAAASATSSSASVL